MKLMSCSNYVLCSLQLCAFTTLGLIRVGDVAECFNPSSNTCPPVITAETGTKAIMRGTT